VAKKYVVTLTEQEREELMHMLSVGKSAARKLAHARVLLKADAGAHGSAFTDVQIVQACDVSVRTVECIRQRFVEQGFHAALERQKQIRPSRQKLLDGEKEAQLVAICCGARRIPRTNRWSAWTLVSVQLIGETRQKIPMAPGEPARCDYEYERNRSQTGVDWQFTAENARIKLKRLYPKVQS